MFSFNFKPQNFFRNTAVIFAIFFLFIQGCTQENLYLENNYVKKEYRIPMRDGKSLFTAVYSPKNTNEKYPILLWRTPYSLGQYGEDKYIRYNRNTWHHLAKEGYIIVFQDVRGRFMSEGDYLHMRPFNHDKNSSKDTDESTDTYDTIDWLVKNVPNNNGKVGIWGISYPGFYAAVGAIDAHPALKAVSPQAPIADWFTGDDLHHNGAFALASNFFFFYVFRVPRDGFQTTWLPFFEFPTENGYQFYLDLGPVKNVNEKYYKNRTPFWNKIMEHGTYDDFWQSRNSLKYLTNIKPVMMVVGGWFDLENLYGVLQTYQAIEKNNPDADNVLVMGPWFHGGWVRSDGSSLGEISFGSKTGEFYIKNIELPFFNYHLKGKGRLDLPEAYTFETGSNVWRKYNKWPPENIETKKLYLGQNKSLSFNSPSTENENYDEYTGDPANPVPFTSEITTEVPRPFMVEDQRFASERPDVLTYETGTLEEDLTVSGPVTADLYVSTSGTDCDWIVKLIDVFPDNDRSTAPHFKGYQMLVRAEIMRSKFRDSYEKPFPMVPNEITNINFRLNDVNHTFLKGHKIMVQVQSSWFPLFDRNPQKFTDIYSADEEDFQKAVQRVYFSKECPSGIVVNILK